MAVRAQAFRPSSAAFPGTFSRELDQKGSSQDVIVSLWDSVNTFAS